MLTVLFIVIWQAVAKQTNTLNQVMERLSELEQKPQTSSSRLLGEQLQSRVFRHGLDAADVYHSIDILASVDLPMGASGSVTTDTVSDLCDPDVSIVTLVLTQMASNKFLGVDLVLVVGCLPCETFSILDSVNVAHRDVRIR